MAQERIVAGEPIPLFAIDAGQGMDDFQRHDPGAPPCDGAARAGNARQRARRKLLGWQRNIELIRRGVPMISFAP
ncbi:hypothetical protein D3C83_38300 [compost metagenome]